ncbi:MAG: hypothetical protein OXI32_03340 [bacterium]|nr:hypothetical protein [bacterium]
MAAQLAHLAVPYCKGSHRAAVDLLSEDIVWATLRKGQKLLRPDIDKRFRLPKRPPSREQYKRYIDEYLDDETSEKMADALQRLALEAARHCGMLNKEYEGKTSTLTDPHRTQIVGADETRVPALYRAKPDECFDPETGEKTAQCDPDAVSYADDDKQPMHPTLIATVRSDFENERIAIMAELKEYGKRDSTAVVDKILQLCDRYPHLLVGLAGVAYDMDMRAEECDRLLARKIIPIGKVQHNNRGLPASYELGELTFKRRAEKTGKNSKDESGRPGATASDATTGAEAVKLPVTVIDGVPTIPVTIVEQAQSGQDPELLECDQPLDLAKVQAKKGPSGYIVRTLYKVPGLPHIPRSLRGLSVWIRQNNTPEEIEAGMPRTRSLRIYAEGVDPRFDLYYGVRGDPESTNHHFKSSLINRRAGSVGKHRYRLDLLAYQATTIVTTLAAYHRRTKTDATHWFGQPNIDRKFKVNLKFA